MHEGESTGSAIVTAMRAGQSEFVVEGGRMKKRSSSRSAEKYVRIGVLQVLIDARPDLVWFHAGAAAIGERTALVVGRWGAGKSSIIRGLCERGATYFSDDIAPFNPATGRVASYPLLPANRKVPNNRRLTREAVGRHPKETWIPDRIGPVGSWALPGVIVFPSFDDGVETCRLEQLSPTDASRLLLDQCFGLGEDTARGFGSVIQLIRIAPAFRLLYRSPAAAGNAIYDRLAT